MSPEKIIFIVLGGVCLALGSAGIALPVLPTVPFYLATVFFWANSSKRLHSWFISTKLYKKHLESFVQKKGMLTETKAGIVSSVTALMALGFILMLRKGLYIPCVVLALVWLGHIVYFFFGVKTIAGEDVRA